MNAAEIMKQIETEQMKESVSEFHVGDTVKVYGKIVEGNRERIQVFEGIVLKKQGSSNRETFTVRKLSNGVGVEYVMFLHFTKYFEKRDNLAIVSSCTKTILPALLLSHVCRHALLNSLILHV